MERFVAGDVVAVAFPYPDGSGEKRRPALVLAASDARDLILCQITSKERSGRWSRMIDKGDFDTGDLPMRSCVRVNKLFTADRSIVHYKRGTLNSVLMRSILKSVQGLFDQGYTK